MKLHSLPILPRKLAFLLVLLCGPAFALDPPHDAARSIVCVSCHVLHNAPGGVLNTSSGNANVCLACHVTTGQASARPFADSDQSMPPLPLTTGWTAGSGSSHRFDSGPSGHVKAGGANTSTGRIASVGNFSGRIEEAYTITISTAGSASTARFNWSSLRDGSGASILAGSGVSIGSKGLSLNFTNGAGTPSFVLNDQWTLYARTDIRRPDATVALEYPLALRMMGGTAVRDGSGAVIDVQNGKVSCSTCHDQHNQRNQPFDAAAPAYGGAGTGWTSTGIGRHFQRQNNDSNQMCKICHSARNVASSSGGSHPVGIAIPGGNFQTPASLPLGAGKVECMSCHAPHFQTSGSANGGVGDGFILRLAIGELCSQCHTNADRTTGAHFNTTTGALWGGTKDTTTGTQFPPHQSNKRGFCINCHWPHGWPDRVTPTQDYPKLWVERYDTDRSGTTDGANGEKLCFSCHTTPAGGLPTAPATSDIQTEFGRGSALATATGDVFRHPVNDTEQQLNGAVRRVVECVDCHNPHKATNADRHASVSGVDLSGATIAAGSRALVQYELCFKCHGDTFNNSRPNTSNKRLDFNTAASNSAYHPVVQAGRNVSANLAAQLRGGLTTSSTIRCTDCHNSSAFSAQVGPIPADTTSTTVGPHGSANAPILRAGFGRSYTSTGWTAANGNLCFGCHLSTALFGSNTNFTDNSNPSGSKGKGNLHDYHLNNKSVTASCMSCHYDIHSNRSASNTEYCVGTSIGSCTVTTSPPSNVKSHLINFAPDVTALNYAKPRWHINTTTGVRTCDLTCHGSSNKMDRVTYKPSSGDDTYTY